MGDDADKELEAALDTYATVTMEELQTKATGQLINPLPPRNIPSYAHSR